MTDDENPNLADPAILDEQTTEILRRLEADPFLDLDMNPAEMRIAFDRFYAGIPIPFDPIASVEDRMIGGPAGNIAIRIYTPFSETGTNQAAVLFLHGGGMMMGSLDAYDTLCRRLAAKSSAIIVSSSYRLAPEAKFPAAVEDALAAFEWLKMHGHEIGADTTKLAVAGESGGGNLAAVVAMHEARSKNGALKLQVLINPAVGASADVSSMQRFARGFFFEPEVLEWFLSQYLEDPAEVNDERASPVLSTDFSGLPSTQIVYAGCDILRDHIENYANHLRAAGVDVEQSCYENTIHGFTVMAGIIDVGRDALDKCAEAIRQKFYSQG